MRILGIIPARAGSKSIKSKNIKLLGGKPLIGYTIESALRSEYLTDILVSTDGQEIAEVAKSYNIKVPFLRPEYLSSDQAKSIDVVIHALEFMEKAGEKYDAVCLLQPTSPFRPEKMIDGAINEYRKLKADSLISVIDVPHHFNPHWVFEEANDGLLQIATGEKEIITRRQELPKAFVRDGCIYITQREIILNRKSFFGDRLIKYSNDSDIHINIDTMDDWQKAEEHLSFLKV